MNRSISSRAALLLLLAAGLAQDAHAGRAPAATKSVSSTRVVLPAGVVPGEYRLAIEPHVDAATFDATVEIDVQVTQPTDRIVLNSTELVIEQAVLDAERAPPAIALDPRRGTATFAFAHRLASGAHTLRLAYHGKINDQAIGLFKLAYDTPGGKGRMLYTQFENSDARRFVPCWDEPGIKSVFRLTATLADSEMAVGNMPIESTEALPGARKRVHFAPTPRMSVYLLFFGAGDFERVHRDVDGVDVGVVVKRGDGAAAAYALDTAARMLAYYNDYFGVRYPLPKLDLVAGPGRSEQFAAMENWGAIFFFEHVLLVDPRRATEADRQRTYGVIAHEMSHQWFGNLVTMAWWDDLWLNEGFASWMQVKATDQAHPEWNRWLRSLGAKQWVMDVDARRGTHPVVTPIDDVEQAAIAFDGITYTKGAQVIRTLEAYLGEDAFRAGVRRYIARHAYGNTVTDDLWHAMDEQGATPVTAIAHDLTLQSGVPLVTEISARCEGGRTTVVVAQDHFAIDAASTTARRWRVPLTVAIAGGATARAVVAGPAPQPIVIEGCGPVVLNAGQTGYFRSRYTEAGLHDLLAHYAALSASDQLGLLNDTSSLALTHRLPMATLMAVATAVPADADPLVVIALVAQLRDIDKLYAGMPAQARWRAFARRLVAPMMAAVGPRHVPGESDNAAVVRADLLAALAEFDDPAVLAEALRLFATYRADPAATLDPELRKFMLQAVASHADASTWDALHDLARQAPTTAEQQEFHELLASAIDPALATRLLALTRTAELPATTMPDLVALVGVRHPVLAFDFALAHWPELSAKLGTGGDADYLPGLVEDAPDTRLAARLRAFGSTHIPVNARKSLHTAISGMTYRAAIRRDRLPEIDAWLARRPEALQ